MKRRREWHHDAQCVPLRKATAASSPSIQQTSSRSCLRRSPCAAGAVRVRGPGLGDCCRLTWRDVQPNGDSGQVTLFGKGEKTRVVKLSAATYRALLALRGDALPDAPVFRSQKGGHLAPSQVFRIVRAAGWRAGNYGNASPHWLRHSYASHTLDRGAPVTLVRDRGTSI